LTRFFVAVLAISPSDSWMIMRLSYLVAEFKSDNRFGNNYTCGDMEF
jgi:hypothetical protein